MLRININERFILGSSYCTFKQIDEIVTLIEFIVDDFPFKSTALEVKDLENFVIVTNLVVVSLHHQIYRFNARHLNGVYAIDPGQHRIITCLTNVFDHGW